MSDIWVGPYISCLWLCNKLLQKFSGLKNKTSIFSQQAFCFCGSGIQMGPDGVLRPIDFHQVTTKNQPGLQSSQDSTRGLSSSLTWSLTGFRYSLAIGQRHLFLITWLSHRVLHDMAAGLPQASKEERKREQTRLKTQSFCNSTTGVTAHLFCWIIFIRSESLGPVHTQREDIA